METAPTAERGSAARAAKRSFGDTLTGRTRARESISGVFPSMPHMREGLMKARKIKGVKRRPCRPPGSARAVFLYAKKFQKKFYSAY